MTLYKLNRKHAKSIDGLRTNIGNVARESAVMNDRIFTENCGDPQLVGAYQNYRKALEFLSASVSRYDQKLIDEYRELKNVNAES